MPFLSPSAVLIASPSARPTSSTVWCPSTCRSPLHVSSSPMPPWRESCSSMWSKKPSPVDMLAAPPSRQSVSVMSVSLVLRVIVAVRMIITRFLRIVQRTEKRSMVLSLAGSVRLASFRYISRWPAPARSRPLAAAKSAMRAKLAGSSSYGPV